MWAVASWVYLGKTEEAAPDKISLFALQTGLDSPGVSRNVQDCPGVQYLNFTAVSVHRWHLMYREPFRYRKNGVAAVSSGHNLIGVTSLVLPSSSAPWGANPGRRLARQAQAFSILHIRLYYMPNQRASSTLKNFMVLKLLSKKYSTTVYL